MELKDKTAIITGSSSGIGAQIAKQLAQNGCHVMINYNANQKGAEDVCRECLAFGVKAVIRQADVSDDTDCKELAGFAESEWGQLDILVNNAGTTKFCDHLNLEGLDRQDFQNIYATNTIGPFQMTRAAKHLLEKAPTAHVINMASIAGIMGVGSSIAYAASKGALITMTLSLARILGPKIRVNAICPGFVQGEWLEKGIGTENYNRMLKGLQEIAPLKDTATPERVAQTAIGILTSMDWTTGETFIVDGGAHLHTAPLKR